MIWDKSKKKRTLHKSKILRTADSCILKYLVSTEPSPPLSPLPVLDVVPLCGQTPYSEPFLSVCKRFLTKAEIRCHQDENLSSRRSSLTKAEGFRQCENTTL